MENNVFKGSIFGGFNRQDVMNYIEKASRESTELLQESQLKIEDLEKQLQEAQERCQSLQSELEAANAAAAQSEEALKATQVSLAETQTALENAQSLNHAEEEELRALRDTIAALQPEVEEFHTLKSGIASVELDARHRAESSVAEAKAQAGAILRKAQADAEALLSSARAKAEKTTAEATAAATATRQKADQHALMTRQQLAALLRTCQEQYDGLLEQYKSAALQAATSLQKAQESVTTLPAVFDKLDDGIQKLGNSLKSNPRKE
jgi:cell division septum initiation protein DivIVA